MAEIRVARGAQLDIFLNLLTQAGNGGSLTDDDDWVDGTTADEWPEVKVWTQAAVPVDVTAQVAKDIAADSVQEATHKHPDTESGLWRLREGQYAFRALPSTGLALGNYNLVLAFDVLSQVRTETHTLIIVEAGDIEVSGASSYITSADVLANFEIADVVTSTEVDKARETADRMVNAYFAAEGIDYPVSMSGPAAPATKTAAIAFARAELRRLKAVGTGLATGITGLRRIVEADVTFDFVSGDSQFKALHEEGAFWMDLAVKALLGSVYFKVGTMGRPAGGR